MKIADSNASRDFDNPRETALKLARFLQLKPDSGITMKPLSGLLLLVLSVARPTFAQSLVADHAKICHTRSPKGKYRMLLCTEGVLKFDDSAKNLTFTGKPEDNRTLSYNDVGKVVFEVTTHMRGGGMSAVLGPAGYAIDAQHVSDYWMYVAPKGTQTEPFLLEISKEESQKVIDHTKAAFGDRVTLAEFAENGEEIDKSKLKDLQGKYKIKYNKEDHPVPEIKADKALVVILCPALPGAAGGDVFKFHANDHVVAVNVLGTYSFVYLDPGKYLLASELGNANGFEMNLEAGKDYYFMENIFAGWKAKTHLTRNSKELVLYRIEASYLSDWTRHGN